MKKIIVIEDNEKHLKDAQDFFATKCDEVVASFYKDFKSVMDTLKDGEIDGVISDIYFPHSKDYPEVQPIGVVVMMLCRERNIPCKLNTAGFHHGSKYQWIHELTQKFKFPMMLDMGDQNFYTLGGEGEAQAKNWEYAYSFLVKSMK